MSQSTSFPFIFTCPFASVRYTSAPLNILYTGWPFTRSCGLLFSSSCSNTTKPVSFLIPMQVSSLSPLISIISFQSLQLSYFDPSPITESSTFYSFQK